MKIANSPFKTDNRTNKIEPVQIQTTQKTFTSKIENIFVNQSEDQKTKEIPTLIPGKTNILNPEYINIPPIQQKIGMNNVNLTKPDYRQELSGLSKEQLLQKISCDEIRNIITDEKLLLG